MSGPPIAWHREQFAKAMTADGPACGPSNLPKHPDLADLMLMLSLALPPQPPIGMAEVLATARHEGLRMP